MHRAVITAQRMEAVPNAPITPAEVAGKRIETQARVAEILTITVRTTVGADPRQVPVRPYLPETMEIRDRPAHS